MAIIAKQLDLGASIEQLRQEFNNLQADVETIQINPTYGSALIFEGPTDDEFETTLQVQDPTSDNLVYIPNNTGTLLLSTDSINATTSSITANNTTNETVYPIFTDAQSGNRPLENDSTLTYNPSTNTLSTTTFVGNLTGDVTGTADIATSITVSANNSTNETVYPTFVDGVTGTQGAETDTGLTYNPSTNTLTTTTFVGNLTGNVTGNLTGNADTFTVSANNSTDETVYPIFVDGATGTQGAESDTALTYNPSTNLLTTGNIVIADAGNIGSSSDTNAIAISAAGVVTLSATDSLSVTGTSTFDEDVTFTGAGGNVVWDKSATSLEFADGVNAYWGTGLDLRIFHDGSNSYIQDTATGSLLIEASTVTIRNTAGTEAMANFTPDGAATLYFDNSAKFATASGGISVTGTYTGTGLMTTGGNIVIPDAGNIGSASDTDAISIAANGNIGITQNLTITGDLTVNGTTTTLAATNSVIGDSLIELNNGAGSNATI